MITSQQHWPRYSTVDQFLCALSEFSEKKLHSEINRLVQILTSFTSVSQLRKQESSK